MFSNSYLMTACQAFTGMLLLASAVAKIGDPIKFEAAAADFSLFLFAWRCFSPRPFPSPSACWGWFCCSRPPCSNRCWLRLPCSRWLFLSCSELQSPSTCCVAAAKSRADVSPATTNRRSAGGWWLAILCWSCFQYWRQDGSGRLRRRRSPGSGAWMPCCWASPRWSPGSCSRIFAALERIT